MKKKRIEAAIEHVSKYSVTVISSDDWAGLVKSSGEPTSLDIVPRTLSGIMSASARVAAAGSGIMNPDPGIDIVRYDPADAPHVYNIYHYKVIENLPLHEQYQKVLSVSGEEDSKEMRRALLGSVYIVGPARLDDIHHVEEIPKHIADAMKKRE